jgi:transaldolase
MKLFVDSANLAEIEESLARGFVAGITTNPSILAKEERTDFTEHIHKIIGLIRRYGREMPLSVEVFVDDPAEMLDQALKFVSAFRYPMLSVKVPIGWGELKVVAELRKRDIMVNCTCCMSFNQAYMAALAGANFVSLFYGRIKDIGYDARSVVEQTARAFREGGIRSEIIVGSIRHIADVNEALGAGAHIVTVPPKFFPALTQHPKTTEAVDQFLGDFRKWSEQA